MNFVTAKACHHVTRPNAAGQPRGNLAKNPVANDVSNVIVNCFEIVHVDEAPGKTIVAVVPGTPESRRQTTFEQPAVRQLRQGVITQAT